MVENTNNTTFVKITNRDIYQKLLEIEKHVLKMNGDVKNNKWIAITSLSLVFLTLGFLFNHLVRGIV